MNRRGFLQAGMAACTASFPTSAGASGPLSGRIKKAVTFQMINEDLSLLDKFKLLKDAGYDGVEIHMARKPDRRELAQAIEATGIVVHGVMNSSSPDVREGIELAGFCGATSVLVVAGEDPKLTYDENFRHWQRLLRAAAPDAEKRRVRLLVENVRLTFLKTAEEMARFIDECDSPLVGAYFDVGNALTWTKQSPEHWARVLGERIVKLHLKDRGHREFGDPERKTTGAIGTDGGEIHWANVRQELTRLAYSGWATAEIRGGGDRKRLAGISKWMDQVLHL